MITPPTRAEMPADIEALILADLRDMAKGRPSWAVSRECIERLIARLDPRTPEQRNLDAWQAEADDIRSMVLP